MIKNIASHLNWIDIVIIVLFLRIIYSGLMKGFAVEIFKLIGILVSSVIALNYYTSLAAIINNKIHFSKELVEFNCFLIILLGGVIIFAILRDIILKFIKIEANSALNKWGGLSLGFLRSFLVISSVLFSLLLMKTDYLKSSLQKSYLSGSLIGFNTTIYNFFWNDMVKKVFPNEPFNNEAVDLTKQL